MAVNDNEKWNFSEEANNEKKKRNLHPQLERSGVEMKMMTVLFHYNDIVCLCVCVSRVECRELIVDFLTSPHLSVHHSGREKKLSRTTLSTNVAHEKEREKDKEREYHHREGSDPREQQTRHRKVSKGATSEQSTQSSHRFSSSETLKSQFEKEYSFLFAPICWFCVMNFLRFVHGLPFSGVHPHKCIPDVLFFVQYPDKRGQTSQTEFTTQLKYRF